MDAPEGLIGGLRRCGCGLIGRATDEPTIGCHFIDADSSQRLESWDWNRSNRILSPILSGTAAAHHPERLAIDIEPGSGRTPINPRSRGVFPVAVLYTEFEDGDGNPVE